MPALDSLKTMSEWGASGCSALVHAGFMKKCIEDVVCGDNGEEKLCPLCLAAVLDLAGHPDY